MDNRTPVVGIAAEYNPFHNGHLLQMASVRERLPGALFIVVLSSNFTQRGIPGLADKWSRAQMALCGGADLVLELPFLFACNAAPEFGAGATDLLARTKIATHISFGMEDAHYDTSPIFNILIQEPASFKRRLRKKLDKGLSYPRAVGGALEEELPGSGDFLSKPNNSLALSYLLRIGRQGYPLIPIPVQRAGAGYHDLERGPLPSAAAIRSALQGAQDSRWPLWVRDVMPSSTLRLLEEARMKGRFCPGPQTLWPLLQALLIRSSPEELRGCAGMDEGLENLFFKRYKDAASYDDFVGSCVCARYTRSRIQRQIIRLLAGVDRWSAAAASRIGAPYARLLGGSERGKKLLRDRARYSDIPIVTRLAAVKNPIGKLTAAAEFRASRLYELLLPKPELDYEERQTPRFEH
nr:nucleotidyltransferase family protein [uncultured Fretibacterium sp.]